MRSNTFQTIRIFWNHAWRYKWLVVSAIFFSVTAIGVELYRAYVYKFFFDALGRGPDIADTALKLLIFWTILGLIRVSFWRITNFCTNVIRARGMADLMQEAYDYLQGHSYRFFSDNFVGSLVTKVKRFESSFDSLVRLMIYDLGRSIVTCSAVIAILFFIKPLLGVIALAWAIIYVFGTVLFIRFKLPIDVKKSQLDSDVTAQLADTITNQLNIKIFNNFSFEKNSFSDITNSHKRIRSYLWNLTTVSQIFQVLSMVALEFILFYYGIYLWKQGLFTLGDFALIQFYMFRMFDLLWDAGDYLLRLYEALADAQEMTEILLTPHEVKDIKDSKPIVVNQGSIVFNKVQFSYVTDNDVLEDYSLEINPSEKVALVGSSGSGKTTVVKLLLRFFDVQNGEILIDGQDISKVSQGSLRDNVSLVPQDPILFHRTLFENISYAKPGASEEEVINAAKLAHCHEFISKLPEGYRTFVGERGVKLSGGERQRVAIARAILKNAKVLVLDEATSSLDSESERLIQDALYTLMKDKTVLVIAHRLSTIMQMDRIVVMENGRIKETGKHQELLKINQGTYQRLWHIQAGSFAEN